MKRTVLFLTAFLAMAAWGRAVAQERFTLTFQQARLSFVLQTLARKTGIRMVTDAVLGDRPITAYLENVAAEEAIDAILHTNGLYREKLPGTDIYAVYAKRADEAGQMQTECIFLKNVKAQEMARNLSALGFRLAREGQEGNLAVDARTNAIIAMGTRERISQMKKVISLLDVEHTSSPIRTGIYRLKHAQVQDIWALLPAILKKGASDKETDSRVTLEIVDRGQTERTLSAVSAGSQGGTSGSPGSTPSATSTGSSGGASGAGGQSTLKGSGDRTISGNMKMSTPLPEGFSVIPDERTNSLIMIGTDDFVKEVEGLLAKLDQPTPQVSIEAVVVELTEEALKDIGMRWGNTSDGLGAFSAASDITLPSRAVNPTISLQPLMLSFQTLTASLRLLESKGEANILANPRVTTLNNMPATIKITSTIPVAPKVTTESTGGTGTTTTEYEFRDIGVTLVAIPHVGGDSTITLDVQPQVITAKKSSFFSDAVETSERSTLTKVLVRNGETLVIGGLLNMETTKGSYRLPLLGNALPFLFSNRSKQTKKTDLVIFLTPKILSENAAAAASEKKPESGGTAHETK